MTEADALDRLKSSAEGWNTPSLAAKQAYAALDENREGEAITRVLLLVSDPEEDTWDVDLVRELRQSLGKLATELRLPPVSLTLVAESERDEAEVFAT